MKITVILPAYNAEKHLAEALQSVLSQTHSNFELIAVNDGSKDNTLDILKSFQEKDSRIRIIDQDNQGIAFSLNNALRESQTEWVAVMHADDIMHPQRLERQASFLAQNTDVKILSCLAEYISETGKKLGQTTANLFSREQFQWHLNEQEAIGILHPGVLFHKDTVLSAGGYRQAYWPAEDIDLWNRLAEAGHLILVQKETLMKYRVHNGSVSTSRFTSTRLKYEWVRACMRARRSGQLEPSWEAFLESWKKQPLYIRINRCRKTNAKAYYHAAGHDYLRGNYLLGTVKLIFAALLQPNYVLPRLQEQVFK